MKVFQRMNLAVATYALQKYMDALQETNALSIHLEKKKKKAPIFFRGVWNAGDVAEAREAWLNEQVSPI